MTAALPRTIALIGLLAVAAFVLVLVGRPLGTDDFWWHLAFGRAHLAMGPVLAVDPLLHTAELPPSNGAWLFQIVAYTADRVVGFHGLRLFHVLGVAGIASLAWKLFRHASGSAVIAHAATSAFLAVSWFRLFQFRPHLITIAAAMGLYRLVIEPRDAASWPRVAAGAFLIAVWANIHPVFLVGPAFLIAALLGIALGLALQRFGWHMPAGPTPNVRALRIGATLVGGMALSVVNPRGLAQHRAFFSASRQDTPEIWHIHDEWAQFVPWDLGAAFDATAGGPVSWFITVAVGLLCCAVALRAASQRRLDPVLLGLSAASFVAIAVAVRFQWMIVFPLLLIAATVQIGVGWRRWSTALLSGAIALSLSIDPVFAARNQPLPARIGAYLERPFDGFKHFPTCVGFLKATGIEGRLFNTYSQGGFVGYWLAPRLRAFVNGTLNYPSAVGTDMQIIGAGKPATLEALDRNNVDIFLGTGLPIAGSSNPGAAKQRNYYTTIRVDHAPSWIPVFRSLRCSVSIRADENASPKLERIAAYYESVGVPFDPAVGFDVPSVLRRAPDFSERHALLPRNSARLREIATGANLDPRRRALTQLAENAVLVGAYEDAARYDREVLAMSPSGPASTAALRRLVFANLQVDEVEEARTFAARLLAQAPGMGSERIAAGVKRYAELRAAGAEPGDPTLDSFAAELPLLGRLEAARIAGRYFYPALPWSR